MELTGIGAGLAALAFWGFLAIVVVAGIWYDIRRRESQQETVRRIIESGQKLEPEVVDRLLDLSDAGQKRPDREFRITALWVLPVAPGLFVLAQVLGSQFPEARTPLLGAAGLVACLGVGFWLASMIAARWYRDGETTLS
jgi:hypothetical protein